jgi:hypothetical protein
LDVAVDQIFAVVDVRGPHALRLVVEAADVAEEVLGRLSPFGDPDSDPIDLLQISGVLASTGLATVLHLDPEGHASRNNRRWNGVLGTAQGSPSMSCWLSG